MTRTTLTIPPATSLTRPKTAYIAARVSTCPKDTKASIASTIEGLAKALEEIQQKLDEQGITLDPNPPEFDYPISSPSKKWVANNIDLVREEAAKFEEELKLRIERQKAWPAIEERRRKKLAQIYPSHSDDEPSRSNPPDP